MITPANLRILRLFAKEEAHICFSGFGGCVYHRFGKFPASRAPAAVAVCRFGQKGIPLPDISPDYQSSAVFIKLIKSIRYFLAPGLDSKIGLAKGNGLFPGITILND